MGGRDYDKNCEKKRKDDDCDDGCCRDPKTAAYIALSVLSAMAFLYIVIQGSLVNLQYVGTGLVGGKGYAVDSLPSIAIRAQEYLFNVYVIGLIIIVGLVVGIKLISKIDANHRKSSGAATAFCLVVAFLITTTVVGLILTNATDARAGPYIAGWFALFGVAIGLVACCYLKIRWYGVLMFHITILLFAIAAYILIVNPTKTYILSSNRY